MGYGKSIELFLANGTADSLIIAELSKRYSLNLSTELLHQKGMKIWQENLIS